MVSNDSNIHYNDINITSEEFPKKYNPKVFEDKIYLNWEDNGKFIPKEGKKEKFYIPMPPPNVTSKLHVGHSIMLTLEDIMTRYHRMK
ncbi:MAG: class I tRNA ligase family protein [Candidatus Peribacteria bacterium]|nr:class I tRNA ligase family protein [Candidatus Peribacteria bacterium]